MTEIIYFSFEAIAPILLLLLLGMLLRRMGLFDASFIRQANRAVFRVALPVLLFCNVYAMDSLDDVDWGLVLYATVAVMVLFFVFGLVARLFVRDTSRRGVLWQCGFRSNLAVIGMPLAQALGGAAGVASVSLTNAFTIPQFNVLAVIALTLTAPDHAAHEGLGRRLCGVLKKVATNPLIIGVALGLVCVGVRSCLPVGGDGFPVFSIERDLSFLYRVLQYLAQLATPMALLALGGQFRFDSVGDMKGEVVLGTALRVVVAPVLGLGGAVICRRLGLLALTPGDLSALVALFGSPVAVSSAVMAAQMGGDEQLAGQYVVWTSLLSMVTIFCTVVVLRAMGLL